MEIKDVLGGNLSEIRYNLCWDDYKGIPALNPSVLTAKSLKHLRHDWYHGQPDSDAKQWGRAVHCLLLEGDQFERRYKRWATRRAGGEYEEFQAEAETEGAEVLTAKLYDSALFAAKAFLENKEIKDLITTGQREVSLFTPEYSMQCKGRLDWVDAAGYIVDVKTTNSLPPRAFSRTFYNLAYDTKMGLYQRWLEKLTGGRHWPVKVIVLESKAPFDSAVMDIPEAVLERGLGKGLRMLQRVKAAICDDCWPGVAADGFVLDTPAWEMDEDVDYSELEV